MDETNETSNETIEISFENAVANAVRLLYSAEMETNLQLMERLEKLADSWLTVAQMMR